MLCYMGHVLTDNRHGLVVNAQVTLATGTAERDAAGRCLLMPRVLRRAPSRSARTRTTTPPASSAVVARIVSRRMWRKTLGGREVQQLTGELRVGRAMRSASKNVNALSRCSDGARQSVEFDR